MGLKTRYTEILNRIEKQRPKQPVQLVAVSKTVSVEQIQALYDLGHLHFGESRLQEALPKMDKLPKDIIWHFIGKLQSNKARKIAERFQVIHSLDTESAAREIVKVSVQPEVLIEVNIEKEPQKSGICPEALDSFIETCVKCQVVRLKGLMTIGPADAGQDEIRQCYRRLRELKDQHPMFSTLSMGMSQDFEVAIQEGANYIRVGTALFGERQN